MRYNYYGSTPMGNYRGRYGEETYREYEGNKYNTDNYVEQMHRNYQSYSEQRPYITRDASMQKLSDTLESIVNIIAMLKKEVRSPEENDLLKRYIVTINEL